MILSKPCFNLQLISKYRTELMGFATILILLCHAYSNGVQLPHILEKILALGQTGVELFLFLSGIGIYYSLALSKNKIKISHWYYKRIMRLMLPYWLICGPSFIFILLTGKITFLSFIGKFTTIGYWFGEQCAWFVAAIIPLYLISPALLKLFKLKCANFAFLGLIICLYLILFLNKQHFWGDNLAIQHFIRAITVTPSFILGFFTAPLIADRKELSIKNIIIIVVIVVIFWSIIYLLLGSKQYWLFILILSAVICKLLELHHGIISIILAFLGSISLESYLLNTTLPAYIKGHGNLYYLIIVVIGIIGAWIINKVISKFRKYT